VIVPLRAVFELTSEGNKAPIVRRIRTDRGGNFSTLLPQGRYRLRLLTVERALPTGTFIAVPLNTVVPTLRHMRVPRGAAVRIDLEIRKAAPK
jgi:hypothetical protein